MKNVFRLCLLFIGITVQISAQTSYFDVNESNAYKDQHKTTNILSIYTTPQNLTIVARKSKSTLIFESFDENAKGKKIKSIPLSKKESFVGEFYYDNQVRVFMVESPSKTKRILNCYTLNISTFTSTKATLLDTNVEKKSALFSGQNKRQTNFSISPNKKFIAITTDNVKKNSNSYDVHLFDAKTLSPVFTKAYYANEEKYYTSSDMVVDNNGVVFSIGKEYFKGRRERKKAKANYSYVLTKIDNDNIATGKIELTEDEYIKSMSLSFYKDNLRLIGYYSQDKVFGIKGVSQFSVDKNTLSVLNKKKAPLPNKVFEDLYGYRNAKSKKDSELTSFNLDYILEDEKGNTFLIAEEFYVVQVYVSNGMNGGYYVTTYHYDDILITKLDANGNLKWGRSIFKRATEPSYNAFLKNDKLYILLNSGKKLSDKSDGRLKVSKGWFESTSLYAFVYDIDGNLDYEKIQDNKGKTTYIPYLGSYNNGKFVMYNHSKGRKQIMMLKCKQ
ncbi:hypothetical protein [Polaribacter sp. R77954]|uniref:hypothetical protein n=1 Tax=Polaribacter sp. R77954 TaxID=3093870 RepID=UPI0037C77C54